MAFNANPTLDSRQHVETNKRLREALEHADVRSRPRREREAREIIGVDDHVDLGDGGSRQLRHAGAE